MAGETQTAFVDLWFNMAGEIGGQLADRTVSRNLEKANFFGRNIRRVQAAQNRRAFISQAREAIAQTTVVGQATQGLDSSAVRGSRASLQTQAEVALSEQEEVFAFGERKIRAEDRARRHSQSGASLRRLGAGFI